MISRSAWFLWLTGSLVLLAGSLHSQERVMPLQDQHALDLEARYEHALPPGQFNLIGGDNAFPALWIEQMTGTPQGGALIVHDDGQHPDWPRLVHDMRMYLPETGWSSLAISVPPRQAALVPERNLQVDEPVPGSAAGSEVDMDLQPEITRRLQEGLNTLEARGLLNIVFIGVGSGAVHTARFVAEALEQNPDAGYGLVLIGAHARDTEELMGLLGQINVPVLDVYLPGPRATQAAQQRLAAINRAGLTEMTQVQEQAWATARRNGPQVVTRRTWGWLRSTMAGREEVRMVN